MRYDFSPEGTSPGISILHRHPFRLGEGASEAERTCTLDSKSTFSSGCSYIVKI